MAETLYAVAVKWGARCWMVVTGRDEWLPYYFRQDALGEHARWQHKMRSKYPRQFPGELERIGPPILGVKVPRGLDFRWVRIDFFSELAGLALTGWAIYHAVKGRPRWQQPPSPK